VTKLVASVEIMSEPATPMRALRLTVPSIAEERDARDLENALVSVAGVARIDVDPGSRTLIVEYDPDYVGEETLRQAIRHYGYPLEES
jgi:copper chaperone CopZ